MLGVDEGMQIRYMQGDSTTHLDVLLNSGDEIPAATMGRGGTDFDAYFTYMRQYTEDASTTPDIVIVYTDGYAPAVSRDNQLPHEIPVLWLMTPEHARDFNDGYGEIIICDPEHAGLRKA
jgi:predicted metal-dependent peptidase